MAPDDEVADVLRRDLLGVGDGGRVEQVDELGERLRLAVVRRGRGEDQRVGLRGEHVGELVVLGAPVDELVRLVDPDDVPADLLEMVAVAGRALQRVDRHDHPVEIGERVATGGDALAHPLDPLAVETDQRDAGAAPQLVLDLVEDVPRDDGEDAGGAAAALQLGEEHPDLDGLAQADGVGDEEPGLELRHRRSKRLALVREVVGEHPAADREARVGDRDGSSADERLQNQPRLDAIRGGVEAEGRALRVLRLDLVEVAEERRRLIAASSDRPTHRTIAFVPRACVSFSMTCHSRSRTITRLPGAIRSRSLAVVATGTDV